MRRFMVLLALLIFIPFLAVPALANHNYNVQVYVNGVLVPFPDQGPFIDTKTGRTYVPLRFVSEALGADVNWDGAKMTAVVKRDGKTVNMQIGSARPTVNGQVRTLDAPAALVNQRTMVPLRFVSETLGAKVEWVPPGTNGWGRVVITQSDPPHVVDVRRSTETVGDRYKHVWFQPTDKIMYITAADLKAKDYRLDDTTVIKDIRVDHEYVWVKQYDSAGLAGFIFLIEGDKERQRGPHLAQYPKGVFESRHDVVNDRRDGSNGWPTADITKIEYILVLHPGTHLAIANPLYQGGQ